jgi:hypothetical protein
MASIPYKKVVNSVMYYMVNTRPNIVAILGIIVQFFNNLRLLHCQVIKQLLRYLQGIQNLALWYSLDSFAKNINIELHDFCDFD